MADKPTKQDEQQGEAQAEAQELGPKHPNDPTETRLDQPDSSATPEQTEEARQRRAGIRHLAALVLSTVAGSLGVLSSRSQAAVAAASTRPRGTGRAPGDGPRPGPRSPAAAPAAARARISARTTSTAGDRPGLEGSTPPTSSSSAPPATTSSTLEMANESGSAGAESQAAFVVPPTQSARAAHRTCLSCGLIYLEQGVRPPGSAEWGACPRCGIQHADQ